MGDRETMVIGNQEYCHQRLTAELLTSTKELCDLTMGHNYYSFSYLRQLLDQPNHYCYLLIHPDGRLAGLHHHYLTDLVSAAATLKLDPRTMLAVTGGEPEQMVGICQTLGVAPEFRQQGVAFTLSRFTRDQLFALGAASLWAPAWKKAGVTPEAGTLRKQGFHFLCEAQLLWYDLEGLTCPVCGQDHCVCPADIYYQLKESHVL